MFLIKPLLVNYNEEIIKNDLIWYLLMFLAFRKIMRRHTGLLPARLSITTRITRLQHVCKQQSVVRSPLFQNKTKAKQFLLIDIVYLNRMLRSRGYEILDRDNMLCIIILSLSFHPFYFSVFQSRFIYLYPTTRR